MEPKPGTIWRHYKGNLYKVLAVGRHSETEEVLVVYEAQYDSPEFGRKAVWVRPLSMWNEGVVADGKNAPRFTFVQ